MVENLIKKERTTIKSSQAALKVALGGVFSLLVGMASQVIVAYLFGAGSEMDAYFTAMTIPGYLQYSLLGGLPFVVIPAFVHEETTGNRDDAWALAGSFIWITGGFLLAVAILVAVFSTQITDLLAPGYSGSKAQLTSQMLSIMMFTIPFLGLGAFTSAIQNVRGRFFWPASATAIGSLGNLLTLLILKPFVGPVALAWGSLVSAILYGCMTMIPILRHGWKKVLKLRDPRLLEMLKLILPFIFFGFVIQGKRLFERYLASGLPDGQLSYIGYANKISNIFVVLLASSVASAIFPAMARGFSLGGKKGLVKQAEYGMKITFALSLPAVTIISVVAVPLIRLIYERGAFDAATTINVSYLIPVVMLSDVLFRMLSNMIGRTFFVIKDTLTTNLVTSLTIIVYILSAFYLTDFLGFFGLALAQPIQSGLSVIILAVILIHKVKEFDVVSMLKSFLVYSLIAAAAGAAAWSILQYVEASSIVLQLGLTIGGSGLLYLGILQFFDPEITVSLLEMTGLYKVFVGARKSITWSREVLATLESLFHELLYSDRQAGPGKPTVRSPLFPNLLLLTAFVVGLVSPFLIWKGVLPGAVRWIADAAILMMIVLVIFRMLSLNHIPVAFWVIVFFSIIGVVVSLSMGQSLDVTVWGWWLMFQYPFVSLFAYLQPRWPAAFSKKFVTAIIFIAGLEVVVQLGQFVMGEVPGDNLAGTFGKNGTGRLVLVLSIVLAYALGEWLHNRKWLPVAAALGIGLASSVLGEMKLFYLVIVLMGGLAFGIYLLWGKQRWKMVPLLFLLVGALVVFIPIYDAIVPTAGELPLEAYFSNPALVRKYLTMIKQSATGGTNYYDIGRNFAIEYGWEKITEKTINLPFGYGLGARAESVSLGMTGRALAEKDLGFSSGTSALVIIQETGLVGLIGLLIFIAVTVSKLFMQIRQQPDSDLNPLRYGLLIFTLLWPLWLWYNAAWTLRTVMLLYWGILGYVFGENRRRSLIAAPPAVSQSEELTALNPRPMTGEIL